MLKTKTLVAIGLIWTVCSHVVMGTPLPGQALREEATEISKLLRCPASVNLTLYESETAIASELKAQIYLQLQQGKERDAVIDFIVQRYGEQIRYKPALTAGTALLWAAPGGLLLAGVTVVGLRYRGRRKTKQN